MESLSLFARRTVQQSRSCAKPVSRLRPSPLSQQSSVRPLSSLRPLPSTSSSSSSSSSLLYHRSLPRQCTKHHHHNHHSPLRFSSSSSSSSSASVPVPNTNTSSSSSSPSADVDLTPAYRLTFTCKPCSTRSTHRVSKQGYHHGTVLITCPHCKNRHLIADHLKIFLDNPSTLEDILQTANVNGKPLSSLLKRGKLGIRQGQMVGNEGEEDIEFWEDGTETVGQVDRGVGGVVVAAAAAAAAGTTEEVNKKKKQS